MLSSAEAEDLLSGPVVVEEKLDGANLGFSVSPEGILRTQNRGQYLHTPHAGQFSRLNDWLESREEVLFDALGRDLMAFGEWCAARHSLDYTGLPDWWLLFDVYDRRAERFWSTARRDAWAVDLGLTTVPRLAEGRFDLDTLLTWISTRGSAFRDGPLEGLVIRREDEKWLMQRAKLVRSDFTQQMQTHWRRHALTWNRLNHTSH
ncbi:MAG: RNA ligase family protein [Thiobacillus sp.]|nr:RNA ligase family protein [Thiobacillus sp.]